MPPIITPQTATYLADILADDVGIYYSDTFLRLAAGVSDSAKRIREEWLLTLLVPAFLAFIAYLGGGGLPFYLFLALFIGLAVRIGLTSRPRLHLLEEFSWENTVELDLAAQTLLVIHHNDYYVNYLPSEVLLPLAQIVDLRVQTLRRQRGRTVYMHGGLFAVTTSGEKVPLLELSSVAAGHQALAVLRSLLSFPQLMPEQMSVWEPSVGATLLGSLTKHFR